MTQFVFHLYTERRDPGRNMARFYALSLETTLFGLAVSRRFGRIGTLGRERVDYPASEQEALAFFLRLAAVKRRRGYRVCRVEQAS